MHMALFTSSGLSVGLPLRKASGCLKEWVDRLADQAEGIKILPIKEQKTLIDGYWKELLLEAQKTWKRLNGYNLIPLVLEERVFLDRVLQKVA